jgi:hypothetical protein
MPIVYGEAGARKSSKLLAPDDEIMGAFGDPFTFNRYLLGEITFTERINILSRSKDFVNFEVRGYELSPIVQHWKRKTLEVPMKGVHFILPPLFHIFPCFRGFPCFIDTPHIFVAYASSC